MSSSSGEGRRRPVSPARWLIVCTAGEFCGFACGGSVAYVAFTAIPEPTTVPLAIALLFGCVVAGVAEGTSLGVAQWWVLRRFFPELRARAWLRASATAAAMGWLLGGLPSTLISLLGSAQAGDAAPFDPGTQLLVTGSALAGGVLGALFGAVQWRVLRRHATHAGRWVVANALGWAVALPWSYLAGSSTAAAKSAAWALLAVALAGVAMGLTIATATWFGLRRMLPNEHSAPPCGGASREPRLETGTELDAGAIAIPSGAPSASTHADFRDVASGIGGAFVMLAAMLSPFFRGARSHWGLEPELAARPFPGDDLVPEPRWSWTHGIEVDAPVSRVWPWLSQIGADRGGFYSYQWLENLVGCGVRNADDVHPEWEARVGQKLRLHVDPTVPQLDIVGVEREKCVVASGAPDAEAKAAGEPWTAASWLFFVEPVDESRCRVISRYRAACSNDFRTRLAFGPTLVEPIGFAMDRRMLLGIKERAERQRARDSSCDSRLLR